MHEVRGAIERIDDPDEVTAGMTAAFLGEKAVIRVALPDARNDGGFRGVIHLRDELVAGLAAYLDIAHAVQVAQRDIAAFARRFDGRVEECLHDGAPF